MDAMNPSLSPTKGPEQISSFGSQAVQMTSDIRCHPPSFYIGTTLCCSNNPFSLDCRLGMRLLVDFKMSGGTGTKFLVAGRQGFVPVFPV